MTPTPPATPISTSPPWWPDERFADLRQWIEHRRRWLEPASDLLLGVAVVMMLTGRKQDSSALVGTIWMVLRLVISPDQRGFNWPLLLIILLNLRGVVLQEGPKPVGPADYLVIIAAFAGSVGRTLAAWRRSVALLTTAIVICCLSNLAPLLHALAAIANGSAPLVGLRDEDWAGQFFRAGDLTVNQTAMACGLALCLAVPLALRERGWLGRWMGVCSLVTGIASYATGSRMALLFPIVLVPLTLLLARRPGPGSTGAPGAASALPGDGAKGASRWWQAGPRRRPLLAGLLLAGAALVTAAVTGGVLKQATFLYILRKIPGDLYRIKVLACYGALPFQHEDYWLYGAGYDAARIRFCDEDVGIRLTHAHNIFGQLMADAGLVSTAAIAIAALLMLSRGLWALRVLRRSPAEAQPELTVVPSLIAGTLFGFLFSLFELTMLKVTTLEILFGLLPAALFWAVRPQQRPPGTTATPTAAPDAPHPSPPSTA
ncbi:MAG: hypothetical protein VKO65_08770 [Cyanobacteriota bacterium]|nr:hypothetical protein [Cyanobacteriota bacterium]